MRFEKGEKKVSGFELGSIASKSMHFTIYATEIGVKQASFYSVAHPNHTFVGVSLNRHSQVSTSCLEIIRKLFHGVFIVHSGLINALGRVLLFNLLS